jgi:hypothetical protein
MNRSDERFLRYSRAGIVLCDVRSIQGEVGMSNGSFKETGLALSEAKLQVPGVPNRAKAKCTQVRQCLPDLGRSHSFDFRLNPFQTLISYGF